MHPVGGLFYLVFCCRLLTYTFWLSFSLRSLMLFSVAIATAVQSSPFNWLWPWNSCGCIRASPRAPPSINTFQLCLWCTLWPCQTAGIRISQDHDPTFMHLALNRAEIKALLFFIFFLKFGDCFRSRWKHTHWLNMYQQSHKRSTSSGIWLTLLLTSVTLKGLNIVCLCIVLLYTF